MTAKAASQYDIIIAGAGTVGMTLALALSSQTQARIALVESQTYDENASHPGFDARSVALAAHSCDLYQQWGLNDVRQLGHDISNIHVSDQGHFGQCRIHADEYGMDSLGMVVELYGLGKALHSAVAARDNIHWFCPNQINLVERSDEAVNVTLSGEQNIRSRLLIIAEGANSPTRALLGIDRQVTPYGQSAVIANISTNKAHGGWAYERFTEH